jgi:sec-independent protein translocase protein TatA
VARPAPISLYVDGQGSPTGALSPTHWLIIIAILVLLFGARRLPDAARSLGRSTRILKAELHAEPDNPRPAAGSAGAGDTGTAPDQDRQVRG